MSQIQKFFTLFALLFCLCSVAPAAGAGHGLIAGIHKPNVTSDGYSSDSMITPVFGIAFFSDKSDFDILVTQKKYSASADTLTSIQLPFFFRVPMSSSWTLGLGAFADYRVSKLEGLNALDYGAALSVLFPMSSSFFLELRYLHGLANLPGNSQTLGFLLGLRF